MSPPSSAEISTFIASRRTSSELTTSPLIGPALYLGNRIATSGQRGEQAGAVCLAVVFILDGDLAVACDTVDVEQAEAQALHAIRTPVEINNRKPWLPAGRRAAARDFTMLANKIQNLGRTQICHVVNVQFKVAGFRGKARGDRAVKFS